MYTTLHRVLLDDGATVGGSECGTALEQQSRAVVNPWRRTLSCGGETSRSEDTEGREHARAEPEHRLFLITLSVLD
ncbi:MAG TPA: hypothetical protein DEQ98_02520 [Acidobacteria bacterium]|nr:hypothetical protein [Acidobacteriota bacterium]